MELSKADLLSPANAISVAGFILVVYGATHLNDVSGVTEVAIGRTMDLADGFVARRTHASKFGAVLDASLDKAAMAVILGEAWYQHAVPEAAIGAVAIYNIVNAAANIYADRKGAEQGSSKAGKYAMAGQNLAIGLFILANLSGAEQLDAAGWASLAASAPIAAKASYGYTKDAINARKQSRPRQIQKRHQFQRR